MILTKLTKELDNLSKHTNGELILRNHKVAWNFYLVGGQLLYAIDKFHPVRRWDRALKQQRSNWDWCVDSSQLSNNQPWECQLLDQGINQKQLSLIQAKLVIRAVVQECLFELSNCTDFSSDWKPIQKAISVFCRVVALSANEMQTVLATAHQMHHQWQAAGLGHLSPTLAPVLQPGADPQSFRLLDKYLNGNYTLWDIALQQKKSVTDVASSLLPLVEEGILQFREIPDLPVPTIQNPVAVAATVPLPEAQLTKSKSNHKQPLIACIDDSPVLAHTLKKILMPAGYEMLSIPEPMRGFGQLIEHKPDLILLDLLLPNADGYSICKFLRETPVFKQTPIIILTAKNTQIDRARAKLVGATEFLGKPPQPDELLQLVRQYLAQSSDVK